uniref:Uncharacterized protein n=1 Tax=Panagrolaimus sp. ES5 TaxID=591445 RepID=A0AC34FBV6_9BILA
MALNDCKKCRRLKIELETERELNVEFKKLAENYENEPKVETNSGQNLCCSELRKQNEDKEIVINDLTLRVGKAEYEYKQKEKKLEKERDEVKAENAKLEDELKKLQNQNEITLRNITLLESEKKREVDYLNAELKKKDADIASLRSANSNLDNAK